MRTLINAAALRGHGSGAVGRAIVRELRAIGGSANILAYVPHEWPTTNDGPEHRVRAGAVAKFAAENWAMRREITRWPADTVFSLGDTSVPYCPRPHLLLVQNPYLAYGAHERDFGLKLKFRARLELIERYFALGLKTVSLLTVQSQHMRARLVKRWGIPDARILVVPSGVESSPAEPTERAHPFIVYPATASPHKNHVVLAEAMAVLKSRRVPIACLLTVTPQEVPELVRAARRRSVLSSFEFLGNTPHGRTLGLMSVAVGVVLPSKLETFGLPYREALLLGTPVIAADRECAREACGDAALYANADSGVEFADAIQRLWESPRLARELSERGRRRHAEVRVTWREAAEHYWRALERLDRHAHL